MSPFSTKPVGFSTESAALLDNALMQMWLEHVALGAVTHGSEVPKDVSEHLKLLKCQTGAGVHRDRIPVIEAVRTNGLSRRKGKRTQAGEKGGRK